MKDELIVLPDLKKKMDEAIIDAIVFFDKCCPYCGNHLFKGHGRREKHIDHYYPISKGGLDVPWNVLPVCGNCNSKKHDRLPQTFLPKERKLLCDEYLAEVREHYVGLAQKSIENYRKIRVLLTEKKKNVLLYDFQKLRNLLGEIYSLVDEDDLFIDASEKGRVSNHIDYFQIVNQYLIPVESWKDSDKLTSTEIFQIIKSDYKGKLLRNPIGSVLRSMKVTDQVRCVNGKHKRVYKIRVINRDLLQHLNTME